MNRAVAVFAVLNLALSPVAAYGQSALLKKVTIAYASFSPSIAWMLLEKDLGFFREEGIRLESILVRGGGVAVRGLMAGNFDYITNVGSALDAVVRSRLPVKIVATAGTINFWLIAQPEIRSVAELKGKTVAISSLGSATDLTTREIFKRHGLDPFRDIILVAVGASPERLAALTSKAVHATPLSPPVNFKAVGMGFRKLASTTEYVKWPVLGLTATEEKLRQDPQEVAKMVRASLKALKFVLTRQDYMVPKIMEMFRVPREEAVPTYDSVREESVLAGYLSADAERAVIATTRQAAGIAEDIPPERVFDNRFAKQAEQELTGWKPQLPK
jgi:NitT/TauT family transport system substrate-binding protein